MKVLALIMNVGSLAKTGATSGASLALDSSREPFSSGFRQPEPPMIKSEFKANWIQHKWDSERSNIAAGFLYNSLSQKKVRVDLAYDSTLGSSLFDYTNVTSDGVSNQLWTLTPAITSPPAYFQGFVEPAFPLVREDLLISNNAVFVGVIQDPFVGQTTAWDIKYLGNIPATILLDNDNVVQGYDFWNTDTRTRVITRHFNIILGKIDEDVFDFPSRTSPKL